MKQQFTILLFALFAVLPVFAEDEPAERILVVKPVMSTRMDTPTDWGGLAATAAADPRFQMTKVEDYANLYSCTISLKKYCKSNKWKGSYGEYPPALPLNEGWAEAHQFVVVYQDDYGDQENKSNPNAAAGAQAFLVPEDDTEVTFYAVVNENGSIRSYCDAQAFTINTFNNDSGNIVFPAAIGKTSSVTTAQIGNTDNKKLEIQANNHVLRPDGAAGGSKYAIYSSGRHVFTMDFLSIQYNIYKVADTIQNPKIQLGIEAPIAAEALPAGLGQFPISNFPALGGMITAISKTASAFNVANTHATLHYEITPASEEELPEESEELEELEDAAAGQSGTITGSIALISSANGAQTIATYYTSTGTNIVEGLPLGSYTLKVWFTTDSYGDVLINDSKDEVAYATTFELVDEITSVSTRPASDPVVSTQYYNLAGARLIAPATGGVYIVKTVRESGKSEINKIFKK